MGFAGGPGEDARAGVDRRAGRSTAEAERQGLGRQVVIAGRSGEGIQFFLVDRGAGRDAAQDRGVIDGGDGNVSGRDVAQIAAGRAVIDLEADRATKWVWTIAAIEVGHRSQRRLVVGQCGGTREGHDARRRIVAARDAVLVCETEHVLGAGKSSGDRDGGAGQIRAVHIADGETAGDGRGGRVLDVGKRAALDASQRRGIVDGRDGDIPGGNVAQVEAGRSVVDLEADRPRGGAGVVAGVGVGHRSQGGLVVGNRGRTAEREDAGYRVVAAGDAVGGGETEHVLAASKSRGDRDRCAGRVRAVHVADGETAGDSRGGRVLGVGERADLDARQHRSVVDRGDANIPGQGIAQVVAA